MMEEAGESEGEAFNVYGQSEDYNEQGDDKDAGDEDSGGSDTRYDLSKEKINSYYEIVGTIDFINNPQVTFFFLHYLTDFS